MALLLGVDTGGTYTDAALLRDGEAVIATAKALTTRHDLAIGVGEAVRAVLAEAAVSPGDVAMTSLSTTLATNALVEGQGARVCLVFIGFSERDIARQGLDEALRGDPVIRVDGGHLHNGEPAAAFDQAALRAALDMLEGEVSGFAVAGQFAVRNPAHEIAARDIIRATTGAPVTCSHELSAKLGGPKRAMTAVLNARLIGMIDTLIGAAEGYFRDIGITAPMMVVRGDGALISSEVARERPIETILSGPAASIVGARWLTGEADAIVSDIGGTTTDIAVLTDGRPVIDPLGARVGGFRTMVEAVAMRTHGLGGDSEVHMARDGLAGGLHLGPRRLVPISLAARDWPAAVLPALERQAKAERGGEYDGRFVLPQRLSGHAPVGLSERERRLLDRLDGQAMEQGALLKNRVESGALDRLVGRGLVMIAGLTPSDAAHVLGMVEAWDAHAARLAAEIFSRKRTGAGERIAPDGTALSRAIVDQVTEQTAEVLLETAFADDAAGFDLPAAELARHLLVKRGMAHHRGLVALDAGLNLPVIGLGASVGSYYGAVGERLSTRMVLPAHAGVANAIGAVVGQVTMRKAAVVTAEGEGRFRAHLIDGPRDFADRDTALATVEDVLRDAARTAARAAGAEGVQVRVERDVREADIEARTVFVEAEITAVASGRPRIAVG